MSLIAEVKRLKRSGVGRLVDTRIKQFEAAGRKSGDSIFNELCFCILTANYTAGRAIVIQKAIGDGFIKLPRRGLAARLRALGYRFPNTRAEYIVGARRHRRTLGGVLKRLSGNELRHYLACNVKGLGYKEASHFLRNIGYKDYAILDFHIIDVLTDNKIIRRPKTLTPKRYLEVECELRRIGGRIRMNMAELDLYLWFMETGKILK